MCSLGTCRFIVFYCTVIVMFSVKLQLMVAMCELEKETGRDASHKREGTGQIGLSKPNKPDNVHDTTQ